MTTLSEAEIGVEYYINKIIPNGHYKHPDGFKAFLMERGVIPGRDVRLLSRLYKKGPFIIVLGDERAGIDFNVANAIEIEERDSSSYIQGGTIESRFSPQN